MNNNKKFNPNDLIRASLGIQNTSKDVDIDSYIAELITKEAKQKEKNYEKWGSQTYINDVVNKTQTVDKKFLNNIVRRTNNHNSRLEREERANARRRRSKSPTAKSRRDRSRSPSSRSSSQSDPLEARRRQRSSLILSHLTSSQPSTKSKASQNVREWDLHKKNKPK